MDNEEILQRIREFEHRLSMLEFNNEDRQQMMGGQMAGIPIPQQFTPVNPTSFLVEKEKKSWRMYYPEGAYAYAGIRPKTVSPEPQDDYIALNWIENDAGEVYAHVEVELENEQTQIKGVNSITFDGEEGESESESGNIRTITFHIATIEKGEVTQTAFGEIREGDYLKKPGNGRLFIIVGDDSSASDDTTGENSDSSSAAAAAFTANQTGDSTIKIPKANDGKLTILTGDESESESLGEFTANQKDDARIKIPKVNDGKLTILTGDESESESLGSFTANQKDDARIKIPKIPKPIIPPSGSGTLTFIADIQYDISSHQLQKKVATLTVATGAVVIGNWEMITGGQATSHA